MRKLFYILAAIAILGASGAIVYDNKKTVAKNLKPNISKMENKKQLKIIAPSAGYFYHGVYPGGVGTEEDQITEADLESYEKSAGKKAAWVYFTHNWFRGLAFPEATVKWIRARGSIPYIRLMPRSSEEQNIAEPLFRLDDINNGKFDTELRAWATAAKNFGTPILVEFGPEVNGEWFQWNGVWNGKEKGPEKFREAYRRIVRIMREEGAANITWGFHVNNNDIPEDNWNKLENYYPGKEWVDWVGVSIYSALSPIDEEVADFADLMDKIYPRLAKLDDSKPIVINEFGAGAKHPRVNQAAWANEALKNILAGRWPRLIGFSWWNEAWQNDDNSAHDSNMRLQDNPALAKVFRKNISKNNKVLNTFPQAAPVKANQDIKKLKLAPGYYVSPQGNNANPGTVDKPWKTIQFAANKLVAGDTVYIRKGTYKERVMPKNSGTDGKYITYFAYPGEEAVLDGAGVNLPNDQAGLFEINSKSYIKVSGLKIKDAMADENSNGIFVEKSENIIIEKNYTYNTRSSGIGVWSSRNITIDGNEVVKANMGPSQESITVAGTDTFEIKNNSVHDTGPNKEGIDAKDGSRNGKIFKNIVYNVPALGIYVEAWDKHTYNIGVYQNIIYNITDGDGIDLASEMGGLLEDIRVNNNIIYNNKAVGIMVGWNGTAENQPIKNVKIINNTIYNNGRGWGGCISADNKDAEEIVIRNNICSGNHSFEIAIGRTPKENVTVENNLLYSYKADTDDGEITGENFIDADPLFVNIAKRDFHLRAGSPAIDKGLPVDAPPVDFDGRARPQGGGYDLGAFEY